MRPIHQRSSQERGRPQICGWPTFSWRVCYTRRLRPLAPTCVPRARCQNPAPECFCPRRLYYFQIAPPPCDLFCTWFGWCATSSSSSSRSSSALHRAGWSVGVPQKACAIRPRPTCTEPGAEPIQRGGYHDNVVATEAATVRHYIANAGVPTPIRHYITSVLVRDRFRVTTFRQEFVSTFSAPLLHVSTLSVLFFASLLCVTTLSVFKYFSSTLSVDFCAGSRIAPEPKVTELHFSGPRPNVARHYFARGTPLRATSRHYIRAPASPNVVTTSLSCGPALPQIVTPPG